MNVPVARMPLVCLGLSHHTAPVDVRERHAFPASRMGEALVALRDYEMVREAVMLRPAAGSRSTPSSKTTKPASSSSRRS
jgi:hypothetical protein